MKRETHVVSSQTVYHGRWVASLPRKHFPIKLRCPSALTIDEAEHLADALDEAVWRAKKDGFHR
jgi:hypothetical protein